jgi:hypothetical protein
VTAFQAVTRERPWTEKDSDNSWQQSVATVCEFRTGLGTGRPARLRLGGRGLEEHAACCCQTVRRATGRRLSRIRLGLNSTDSISDSAKRDLETPRRGTASPAPEVAGTGRPLSPPVMNVSTSSRIPRLFKRDAHCEPEPGACESPYPPHRPRPEVSHQDARYTVLRHTISTSGRW